MVEAINPFNVDNFFDVVIIGGGISGVYCAWRLLSPESMNSEFLQHIAAQGQYGNRLKIGVFEGSDRIGGRLLSVTPPGMPNTKCELGGMRYISTQKLVRSLVENKLKLPTRPFSVSEPENLAYLRGQHLRTQELSDATKVPYNLNWAEQGQNPSSLLGFAIDQLIPGATQMPADQLRQRLETFEFEGKPLYQYGFWNLLTRGMSREAYEFALQTSGYDTIGLNWNAVDTIGLNFGDFGTQVKYNALVDGYQALPLTLYKEVLAMGGEVRLSQWLKSFDHTILPDGSQGMILRFANQSKPPVFARHLILAMPRRSLELLDQTGKVLAPENQEVHELIRSVTPIPLFKMFVCYHYPWWESVGVKQGQSITDLPIRQCYYWATEGEQTNAQKNNRNSVLLATYDDTLNVSFWAGLRNLKAQPLFETKYHPFAEPQLIDPEWQHHRAPVPMIEEIHRQLQEMHGLRYLPEPYAAAYKDWGDDPFGGGVNFWNIHVKSWEVIPKIIKPKPDVPVYICGEAYSNGQGWVEGALETAEMVLQDHFHLHPPDWITD